MLLEFANDLQALLKKYDNLESALRTMHAERDQLEEEIAWLKNDVKVARERAANFNQHILAAEEHFNEYLNKTIFAGDHRRVTTEAVQLFIALLRKEIK